MNETTIAWTEKTWSPVTGCRKISPGCANCYAERFAERWRGATQNGKPHPYANGFDLQLRPERLEQPGRWTKPSRIFVCSMSDLFQSRIPDSYLDRVFRAMEDAPHHVFQVLTKRAGRMRAYLEQRWSGPPPAHIWVGVTAEDQQRADQRLPQLRLTPARIRFVSAEPLIGPIAFGTHGARLTPLGSREGQIHQVIVGGESGPDFRSMDPDWARAIRDTCRASGISFFFKQHAGVRPKELGHLLDGVEYREAPE